MVTSETEYCSPWALVKNYSQQKCPCLTIYFVTVGTFVMYKLNKRTRAIRAKKSPCGCSLCFALVPKEKWKLPCNFTMYQVALLILTVSTVKHRYIFTTKFPFFKPPL